MIEVRERLTERINRARLKLEVKRALRPALVLLAGAIVGGLIWGYQLTEVGQYALVDSREVKFAVDSASGVVPPRNEVRFRGVPAGTITSVELENGEPVLTARIYKRFGPIYRDARAVLRPNTALEDMYLDVVDRGSRGAGEASSETPLPARQTDTSVQLEEALQVFSPETRTHLHALLRDLGGGLDGRGDQLAESFVKVVPFLEVAARMSQQLADRSESTRRLVRNFSTLTGELAQRDRELRALAEEGGRTLTALGNSSGDLDATLRELPGALSELDASFASLRGVLPDVDGAVRSLGPVADELPGSLAALRALSEDASPAVRALREPVTRLVPLARVLRPFSSHLSQAVQTMRPQVGAIDHVTESTADCTFAIYGFMHWTASVTKFEDGRSLFPRGDAVASMAGGPNGRDPNQRPAPGCAPGMPKTTQP